MTFYVRKEILDVITNWLKFDWDLMKNMCKLFQINDRVRCKTWIIKHRPFIKYSKKLQLFKSDTFFRFNYKTKWKHLNRMHADMISWHEKW